MKKKRRPAHPSTYPRRYPQPITRSEVRLRTLGSLTCSVCGEPINPGGRYYHCRIRGIRPRYAHLPCGQAHPTAGVAKSIKPFGPAR